MGFKSKYIQQAYYESINQQSIVLEYHANLETIMQIETYVTPKKISCNSYTMGCPPVRGDNQRALASGLSYAQVDKHDITILYHLHQCRPCTSRDI